MTASPLNGFFLEDWRVSPAEGTLVRGDQVLHLEPKTMDVLVYLATRPGEVVTREDLEREVWRGALVGYDAVTNTIIKLRKALGDDARKPRYIATIPKKGYQLIGALEAPGEHQGVSTSRQGDAPQTRKSAVSTTTHRYGSIGLLSAVVVIGLVWAFVHRENTRQIHPSIAVLPFENLNADPKQDFLADGITEDIITDLSKLANIQVIASTSSSAFKGKKASIQEIGEELGVTYVVKGTIRRLNENFRVNVQLVNTATGFNAWANRYDRNVKEVFVVQEDVTRNIVRMLSIKTTQQEETRLARKSTNNLKAYDYFQEGLRHYRTITREGDELARESYRKAIELDPNYGRAYGAIAVTLVVDFRWGWTDSPVETLDRALELANKAVELDPDSPHTYWALGFVQLARKEYDKAREAAENSIEVAPNYADGYGLLGLISSNLGEGKKGIAYTEQGMRLNPFYTFEYLFTLGQSYYTLEEYDKAIEVLEGALTRNQNAPHTILLLTACYVQVGRLDDAEWLIEQLSLISPSTTLSGIDKTLTFSNAETRKSMLADLRKAGLPQ